MNRQKKIRDASQCWKKVKKRRNFTSDIWPHPRGRHIIRPNVHNHGPVRGFLKVLVEQQRLADVLDLGNRALEIEGFG